MIVSLSAALTLLGVFYSQTDSNNSFDSSDAVSLSQFTLMTNDTMCPIWNEEQETFLLDEVFDEVLDSTTKLQLLYSANVHGFEPNDFH